MKLDVRRFRPDDLPAIKRFNARLEEAGEIHRVYPETPDTPGAQSPVTGRLVVALEGDELRGAVWLHEQDMWIRGEQVRAGWLRLPLSESVVNPAYRGVPASLIMQVQRLQPRLMALGLGAHDTPFARLLAAFKWRGATVPCHFAVVRPYRVLRELSYARRDPRRRLAMDVAAFSGAGALAGYALNAARAWRLRGFRSYSAEHSEQYGPWADEIWERARNAYAFVPARNAATLNMLYPPDFYSGMHRLRIRRNGEDVGIANVLRVEARERARDDYFGGLTVGLIADGFGPPEHAAGVMAAATRYLQSTGVDLLLSFQQHNVWRGALRATGFFDGPSNFCWYVSPNADQLLGGTTTAEQCHLNRGDAEGPKWF